jgi:signal transduction histidine kinase
MATEGECERRVAAIDWNATALGARSTWPASLRATVQNILRSKQPMLLFWGPELIQFYNDAFVPSFGVGKHPAALGQRAAECWADAWPVVGAQIEAVMRDGEPAWFADALVPIERNGRMEEVFWTYSYSPAFDDAGLIAGTLVIVTEMTARVVVARRLAALTSLGTALAGAATRVEVFERLSAAVRSESADLPFAIVTQWHDDAREVLHASGIDRAVAERCTDALDRYEAPGEATIDAVGAGPWPEPITRALVFELPSGSASRRLTITFGVSPRLPLDAGYRAYLAQITDQLSATLRRLDHAEAARVIEAQRDHLLMQAPVAAALLAGPQHVFQLANPRYREIVGRDPTGKAFEVAFPELEGGEVHTRLDRAYRTGEGIVVTAEHVPLVRDGKLEDRWFHSALEPLRGPAGDVHGMMIVAVDVSEQVRASRAKDEFLAMLGHELRNPLAPIAAAVELMKRKDSASRPEHETIERQLKHVTRLVDDLLDVSRITRGSIELVPRPVEISTIVERAVETAGTLIERRGHRLTLEVASGVFVDGDDARLVQVFANLLTNAARYTPPGGSIGVYADANADCVAVRVVDDGVGMPPDLLASAFDLFVQGERGPDRAEGGLGIGLAIVKNLVTQHGGTVAARSDGPGRGTEVIVTLPRREAPAPGRVLEPALPVAGEPRTVMVVDDNEDAAVLLGELLRMCGHFPIVAHDPATALRIIGASKPDVAVLDLGLPGMDGYALARRLREEGATCRLIALTGYGQPEDRERSSSAGFECHLVKPVDVAQLLAAIG